MTQKVPWLRVFVEGAVIVGSILLAFGIEAWWQGYRESSEELALLSDLVEEFRSNRDRLQETKANLTLRVARLDVIIREAGPEAVGVPSDSLGVLADSVMVSPIFGAEVGVMERAQSGGGLSVVADPQLRARLAGFWNTFEVYFRNQWVIFEEQVFSPPVAYGTGTLVWQDFPRLDAMGSTTMWSDPLTPDQANALKYFSITRFMSNLLIEQGEDLLADLESLILELDEARAR